MWEAMTVGELAERSPKEKQLVLALLQLRRAENGVDDAIREVTVPEPRIIRLPERDRKPAA